MQRHFVEKTQLDHNFLFLFFCGSRAMQEESYFFECHIFVDKTLNSVDIRNILIKVSFIAHIDSKKHQYMYEKHLWLLSSHSPSIR